MSNNFCPWLYIFPTVSIGVLHRFSISYSCLKLKATLLSRRIHCQNSKPSLLVSRKIMRFIRFIIGLFADLMDLKCNFSKKTTIYYLVSLWFPPISELSTISDKKRQFLSSKMFANGAIYHWRTHSKK